MDDGSGAVEKLWLKRVRRGPMDPVESVTAIEGHGLEGNANVGGKRQVTILSAEAWARIEAAVGGEVDPTVRRANVLVSGVDLENARGKELTLGSVTISIQGETRPCRLMEEIREGLQDAMSAQWGGGAFGVVTHGGTIHVGDEVRLE